MEPREALSQALETLSEHPRRVVASAMGVFWGAAAIVVLMSYGAGLGEFARTEWGRFAEDFIMVRSGLTGEGHPDYRKGVWIRIDRRDIQKVEEELHELAKAILPEHLSERELLVEAATRVRRLHLSATDHRFAVYRNFDMGWGRFYDREDVALGRAVAVLGHDAASYLFEAPEAAIGQRIRVEGLPFEVIGVARRKGRQYSNVNRPDNELLLIPITAAEKRLGFSPEALGRVWIFRRPKVSSERVLDAFRSRLGPRTGFHPEDEDAIKVFDGSVYSDVFGLFARGFMLFVAVAGVITLLIGGVGIANYQLAILAERTAEIAVAKAIGARNRVLVAQTLLESTLVSAGASLSGCGLGLLVCAGIEFAISAERFPVPVVSPAVLLVAFFSVCGVAIVAGALPAARVRQMEISAALRAQG
jgi:putative ABC transport system permease protein